MPLHVVPCRTTVAKLLDLKAAVDVQVPAAASAAVKIPEPKQGGPKL